MLNYFWRWTSISHARWPVVIPYARLEARQKLFSDETETQVAFELELLSYLEHNLGKESRLLSNGECK